MMINSPDSWTISTYAPTNSNLSVPLDFHMAWEHRAFSTGAQSRGGLGLVFFLGYLDSKRTPGLFPKSISDAWVLL